MFFIVPSVKRDVVHCKHCVPEYVVVVISVFRGKTDNQNFALDNAIFKSRIPISRQLLKIKSGHHAQ